MLAGWGAFNLVEGIVDHQILTVHHVNPDHVMLWDTLPRTTACAARGLERVLGLGVGDLHHVGAEQCAEARGDPARRSRRHDEAGGEGGGNPEPYAVGADDQLTDRAPQAMPPAPPR
jgi:hypothetical protein